MHKNRLVRLDPSKASKEAESLRLFLEFKLIGQEKAINRVVASYEQHLSPLKRQDAPILCALFTGPSGVGKTYIVELLAEFLFGSRDAFVKIECENYAERHEVSKLLGPPPGYVGYGDYVPLLSQKNLDKHAFAQEYNRIFEGDPHLKQLREEIGKMLRKLEEGVIGKSAREVLEQKLESKRRAALLRIKYLMQGFKPVSIVLFDEIEKAHQTLHNVLLEIAAKGRTTLNKGEEVSFVNSFIFMTSNAGSEAIARQINGKGRLGFVRYSEEPDFYGVAIRELRKVFSPEFLGRIEKDIVVFRPLKRNEMARIMDIRLGELVNLLMVRFSLYLKISKNVRNFLLDESTDHPEYGARLIKDKINTHIEEPLSSLIGSGQIKKGDTVYVGLKQGSIVFRKKLEDSS